MAAACLSACDDQKPSRNDPGDDAGTDGSAPVNDASVDDAGEPTPDAAVPPAAKVLVFGDVDPDTSETTGEAAELVVAALEDADMEVVSGGYYADWDGVTPSLDGVDIVIWLEGVEYGSTLQEAADDALVAFVNGGGVLVRTEWGVYAIDPDEATGIDALMPVTYANDYAYTSTWTATDADHPYLAGVTFPLVTTSGHSYVALTEDAVEIVSLTNNEDTPATVPAVSEKTFGAGKVVHINHDVLYTVETLEPSVLSLIGNIAQASAGN